MQTVSLSDFPLKTDRDDREVPLGAEPRVGQTLVNCRRRLRRYSSYLVGEAARWVCWLLVVRRRFDGNFIKMQIQVFKRKKIILAIQ